MTKQRKQYSSRFELEMLKPIEEHNQRVVDVAKQCKLCKRSDANAF